MEVRSMQANALISRRTKAHYGNRGTHNGQPVLRVKAHNREDFVTPDEIAEDFAFMAKPLIASLLSKI